MKNNKTLFEYIKIVKDLYLVCQRCNGYYRLEDDESPEDFEYCSCGGNLLIVEDLEDYYQNKDYYDNLFREHDTKKSGSKKSLILVSSFLIVVFMLIINFYFSPLALLDNHATSNEDMLGLNEKGYVTKEIYQSSSINNKVIAVVTGIHPREKHSKNVTTDVIRDFSSSSTAEIIHYDITVTNNPENYNIGRANGESLAAQYILPDIKKSNVDLVIICHDHKPGYGSGFYIATPEMDEKSVKLAEFLNQTLGNFRYYRADNIREHSSSALKFSKPLASSGYKTLVYEMPEWEDYNTAYNMTYKLLESCSMFLV